MLIQRKMSECSVTEQGQVHLEKMQNVSQDPHDLEGESKLQKPSKEDMDLPWKALCQDKRLATFLDYVSKM